MVRIQDFLKFCLDLELFEKNYKFLKFLSITQNLNKIKKNPEHLFVNIVKLERVQNFSKNYLTLW